MVRNDILQEVEPEKRKLGEDAAFVGNGSRKNNIEGGEPVRGDDEQLFAEIVDIADLPARGGGETGEMRFSNDATSQDWQPLQCFSLKGAEHSSAAPCRGKAVRGGNHSENNLECCDSCFKRERTKSK